MMSTLRKNTATILWILVVAFIATIIFSWGMGGFKGRYEPGVLAKVNGVKVSRDAYDNALQNRFAYERQANQGQELGDTKVRQIRTEVWNSLVNEILLEQAREKAGISVTNEEVALAVQQTPPPNLRNNPQFVDSLGNFDWAFYRMILTDPQNEEFVIALEEQMRQQLLQQKMLQRIGALNHISEAELREQYERDNSTAKASYLAFKYADMKVDSSLVSEADMRKAYQTRREEFKLEEMRRVQYVFIEDAPSRSDSSEAYRLSQSLKERIDAGDDFAALAAEYSEDPSNANKGGDLDWFGRGRMVKPFEKAIFEAKKGEVIGPVETRFGYHIIRLDGRRANKEGEEEVKASHILIKIEQGPNTRDEIMGLAEGFREEAEETDFAKAANLYNFQLDTLDNVKSNGYIPRLGRNQAAADFLFNRPVGEVSPVYASRSGFFILRSVDKIRESYKPFEDVQAQLHRDLLTEKQKEAAVDKAAKLHKYAAENGLEKAAKKIGSTVVTPERAFKVSDYVSKVGRDPKFTLASFDLEVGALSEPIAGDKACYLIRLDEKTMASFDNWDEERDAIQSRLAQQRQNRLFNEWLENEREAAKIDDFRYLYYTDF